MLRDEQPLIVKQINNMINRARIPQAFVFYGESSTSKRDAAKYFIKELYKNELNINDDDPIIKRIEDESHINVYYIKRDKETTISKDLISTTIDTQNRTSLEKGPRFYIIEDAMYLNKSSMNELLKFVEEPTDNVYIIFIIDNLSSLTDTIISRCSLFHFVKGDDNKIKEELKPLIDESKLNILVSIYQNKDLIIKANEDEDINRIYEDIIDMFKERYEDDGSLILYFSEHIDLFKDNMLFTISMINAYLEDVLNMKLGLDIKIIDEKQRISELKDKLSLELISELINDSLEIKRLVILKKPINFELYIVILLLKLEMKGR